MWRLLLAFFDLFLHRANEGRYRSRRGFSLIEMMIALAVSTVVIMFVGQLMTQSFADVRANMAAQDAADQGHNLLLTFRKNFITKTSGDDRMCATAGLPVPPSSSYCIARCRAGAPTKTDCLRVVTRRGLATDYLDTEFQTLCEAQSTAVSSMVPNVSYVFPSRCRQPSAVCSVGQRPYVSVTAVRMTGGVEVERRVVRFPPTGNGGGSLATTVGAEICLSVSDSVATPDGSAEANIRTYFLGTGKAERQPIYKDDISQTYEEASIESSDIIVLP